MAELTVLVVDDEGPARRVLRSLLTAHADVRVIGECRDGGEAVAAIATLAPELVFLDIKMPEADGFEVIDAIGVDRMPAVVFVTAFDDFAVRAFEVHALDYLVKPFSDARFEETLQRARQRLAETRASERAVGLDALLTEHRSAKSDAPLRFLARLGNRSFVIASETVDWIEAQDYCVLLHVGSAAHLLRESIRALESQLNPRLFARVNRSCIVNLTRVRELRRPAVGGWCLTLADGTDLSVSRRRRDALLQALGQRG
jgi:two-component system LytT family response regulator